MYRTFQRVFLFFVFTLGALHSDLCRSHPLLQDLDPLIEKAIRDYEVPGLAVGVVMNGEIVYLKGFGLRDVKNNLPVDETTLFPMGSCTKALTTFAIGSLVDEGLLSWDQPVIDVLPEFRLWDQYATANVTFRDLLSHRTGLPRHEFSWYNAEMTKEEMLRRIRFLQPSFDFRERYQYGNLMYFVAGLAMEKIAHKEWEDLIRERILSPLKMSKSNFSVEALQASGNFARPYIEKKGVLKEMPFRNLSLVSAAGSLNSNVEEMCRWMQMLLQGGVYEDQVLISPATLQEIQAPQVIVPGAPETKDSLLYAYGMGWGVTSYKGNYFVSHDGVSDGFTSVLGLLPQQGIGIVVVANKNMSSLPRYLSLEIMDLLLSFPKYGWLQEGVDGIQKNRRSLEEKKSEDDFLRKKGTSPSHPLEEYVGIYEHPGYGEIEVTLADGKLEAVFNGLSFRLGHWHYDVFSVEEELQDIIVSFEGTKFTFFNNPDGNIKELSVPFEPVTDDIVFKKRPEENFLTFPYLKKFVGTYQIYGYTVEIAIRNHALTAIIPGQPNYELIPSLENQFLVKTMTGSVVRFIMDEKDKVKEILLIHPYGAFSATPKRS